MSSYLGSCKAAKEALSIQKQPNSTLTESTERNSIHSVNQNQDSPVENVAELNHFYHPYDPYSIQTEFMTTLYRTLESKKIGIFESPTGTVVTGRLFAVQITNYMENNSTLLIVFLFVSVCRNRKN